MICIHKQKSAEIWYHDDDGEKKKKKNSLNDTVRLKITSNSQQHQKHHQKQHPNNATSCDRTKKTQISGKKQQSRSHPTIHDAPSPPSPEHSSPRRRRHKTKPNHPRYRPTQPRDRFQRSDRFRRTDRFQPTVRFQQVKSRAQRHVLYVFTTSPIRSPHTGQLSARTAQPMHSTRWRHPTRSAFISSALHSRHSPLARILDMASSSFRRRVSKRRISARPNLCRGGGAEHIENRQKIISKRN